MALLSSSLDISTTTDPWDYLDGTSVPFSVDAGNATSGLSAFYSYIQMTGLGVSIVLIVSAIVGIIYTSNAQNRAQRKQVVYRRFFAMLLIGLSTSILTLLMTLCNTIFGVGL